MVILVRCFYSWALAILAAAGMAGASAQSLRTDAADGPRDKVGATAADVPPMPDGTPRRLLEFIADLRKRMPPPSRESLQCQKQIATVIVAAAKRLRLELAGKRIEIVGTLLDGTRFEPAVLEGKVVIVDFWATWCGPCMADIPALRKLHDAHRDEGLEIVLVSLDDDADAVRTFVTESRVTWPILFDGSAGKFEHPIATRYGITRIPQKIVVGRDGKVVSIHYDVESLAKTVEALLQP